MDIRVDRLAPRERVTVALRSKDAAGYTWVSSASFDADAHGSLDLGRTPADAAATSASGWIPGLIVAMRRT